MIGLIIEASGQLVKDSGLSGEVALGQSANGVLAALQTRLFNQLLAKVGTKAPPASFHFGVAGGVLSSRAPQGEAERYL